MKTWKGRTEDGTFAVELQASVLGALDRYCRDSGSVETGGILIGCYSADLTLAIVREATPPPTDSKRGRSWFVRGVSGLSEMLGKRWRARERTFYIGEWHFHPANHVEPSGDDFAQMIEISRAREYDCKEPLLLILGASKHEGQRIFRAFVVSFRERCLGTGGGVRGGWRWVEDDTGGLAGGEDWATRRDRPGGDRSVGASVSCVASGAGS